MIARTLLLATALLAASVTAGFGQTRDDVIAAPALRSSVTVSGDLVRIGDIIDNAGSAAQIAIYRAPDLGTTGSLPVAQVLNALRAHQVIGVDTRELKEVTVTRLAIRATPQRRAWAPPRPGPARWRPPSRACVRPGAGARSSWPWRRGWRIPARRW